MAGILTHVGTNEDLSGDACDGEIMVMKGAWLQIFVYHLFKLINTTPSQIQILSIYANLKSGGKNGRHGWVPHITSIASASNILVQLFQHCFAISFVSHICQTLQVTRYRFHVLLCFKAHLFYLLSLVFQSSLRQLYRYQKLTISGIKSFIYQDRTLHQQLRWYGERKMSLKMKLEKTSKFWSKFWT